MILSRGHKLRYVNQLVGVFVILVVSVLFATLLVVAWGQEWFVPSHDLLAYLAEEELDGMQVNTPVQILGERVGKVREIRYVDEPARIEQLRSRFPDDGQPKRQFLEIQLQISDRSIDKVRADSRIHIRRRLAGVGDVYLEILRGSAHRGPASESTIFGIYPEKSAQDEIRSMTGLMAEVQRDFATMRESWVASAKTFERSSTDFMQTSDRVREVARSLLEVTPQLPQLADDVLRTSRDLKATSEQFRQTASDIGQSNRQLQNVLADAEEVSPRWLPITQQTERLLTTSQAIADRLRDETEELPGTINQVRDTAGDAQEVIDGLRQNWLIRRQVQQPETPTRLPSSRVRVGGISP